MMKSVSRSLMAVAKTEMCSSKRVKTGDHVEAVVRHFETYCLPSSGFDHFLGILLSIALLVSIR